MTMERVPFTVESDGLAPANDEARAVMNKLVAGEQVAVEVYRERSNKFASRVNFVFERIGKSHGLNVRNVRGWIAAMTGRADLVTINRKTAIVPWGTGPRDMRGDEFEAFWLDAKQVIADDILPTLTEDDRNAILNMMEF